MRITETLSQLLGILGIKMIVSEELKKRLMLVSNCATCGKKKSKLIKIKKHVDY